MELLGNGWSLRQIGRVLNLSHVRVAEIRNAGEPRPVGRPPVPRPDDDLKRRLRLWVKRRDSRRARGEDVSYAERRIEALEAELRALQQLKK
jgi:hypothetical protein